MPDFKEEIHRAFGAGPMPDEDVIEELAQHAGATYEAARADGRSQAQAVEHVRALIEKWK